VKVLVTGSSGHLGEALMRILPGFGHEVIGLDLVAGRFTDLVGSVADRLLVQQALTGMDAIVHTATLHKPHVATHSKQKFIDVNITGTLTLLEEAILQDIGRFVFTSTTSAFGVALSPPAGAPAAWITEAVGGVPKNIYGVSKTAAENLCELFARNYELSCTVLRVSRFFPEVDDNKATRDAFDDINSKANEFLFRRVDLEDAAIAHEHALHRAPDSGFAKYIISATSPFNNRQLAELRTDPAAVIAGRYPKFRQVYDAAGYHMFAGISRVYVNDRARTELNWSPKYDFGKVLCQIEAGEPVGSELARKVGIKGYHNETFDVGPYPVD